MARSGVILGAALVLASTLTACKPEPDVGYVELRTLPVATSVAPPAFYLDTVKLDPVKKGVAVLRQRVGTAKLSIEGSPGNTAVMCEVVVRKNRITTVTVSVLERPMRCHCRAGPGSKEQPARVCVS
jgi:hypothetical protein